MNTELRKRLEEAAKEKLNCDTCLARKYGECKSSKCLPYRCFLAGAELGYKEAVKVAKEWLEVKIGNYLGLIHEAELTASTFRTAQLITDFEADMSKLWEEQK